MPSPDGDPRTEQPLVVRVPPWQASVVFVIAAVAAAIALYSDFNTGARVFFGLIAIATAVAGLLVTRAYLYVDGDGIGLRRLRARFYPWDEISSVEVVVRKNQPGLYIFRDSRRTVRAPSFLILPLKPAGLTKTVALMEGLASRIVAFRPR